MRPARGERHRAALLDAAHRLVLEADGEFTTQDLVAEAGVALQTFYRHFGGKDQLLLAVFADLIRAQRDHLIGQFESISDPIERLRLLVIGPLALLAEGGETRRSARFIASQHWRLHQTNPEGLAQAIAPFSELVAQQLVAAWCSGLRLPTNVEGDASMITMLVVATFHHYAFAEPDEMFDVMTESLWQFCLSAVSDVRPEVVG